jgi:hypothetical protein
MASPQSVNEYLPINKSLFLNATKYLQSAGILHRLISTLNFTVNVGF